MKENIILIGGGGHCKSCIDVIEQVGAYRIAGIVDVQEKLHQEILGYEIIASDEDMPRLVKEYPFSFITVGQITSAKKRIALFDTLKEMGAHFPVLISPLAYVSEHAQIGKGTIVMHHALVNAGARVGRNCIINTKALVEHDAVIEDHCHIATSAIINGGTHIERHSFIGGNTMVREYITVGQSSVIGGGNCVMQNLPSQSFMKSPEK